MSADSFRIGEIALTRYTVLFVFSGYSVAYFDSCEKEIGSGSALQRFTSCYFLYHCISVCALIVNINKSVPLDATIAVKHG